MPYDPYPMLRKVTKVHTSAEMLGEDLDDPAVFYRPEVTDPDYYLTVHWGGGPNPAGGPIEEPGLTRRQRLAFQLGRVKGVLRAWHSYHKSKGWPAIGYSTWVDSLFGQLGRLRGHRWNGGQWGTINHITHALVLVMGLGQRASRLAWRTVGLVWFCAGGPRVVGHRFFNDWPESQTTTSCPGDENSQVIADEGYVAALGVLRHRKAGSSRGRRVRAVTLKLTMLGLLDGMRSRFTVEVAAAVGVFRAVYGVPGRRGVVDGPVWRALAAATGECATCGRGWGEHPVVGVCYQWTAKRP